MVRLYYVIYVYFSGIASDLHVGFWVGITVTFKVRYVNMTTITFLFINNLDQITKQTVELIDVDYGKTKYM